MNVMLPSWDELDSGIQDIPYTPVQAVHAIRSHSLASLHLSSSSTASEPRKPLAEEHSVSSDEVLPAARIEPEMRSLTRSPIRAVDTDLQLKNYRDAVVEASSAMDLVCGQLEQALTMYASDSNFEEISAVLPARLASIRSSVAIPIESMRVGFDRLCALVSSLAEQVFEGANTQRKVYQQELARIQETANMATRKAVSAHREQAALQMEQLKANLGTENSKLLDEISTKYQQCQEANRFYESEVNRLTSELKQQEKFRQELLQQHDAQTQHVVTLQNENWKQKQAELEYRYSGHLESIKEKLERKLLDVKRKYEQQLTMERNQFGKREDELSAEHIKLRKQVEELSQQLACSVSEIEAMTVRQNDSITTERDKLIAIHEEKLRDAQLHHFQLLTAVKEQAATQVAAIQNEALREHKRREAVYKAELKRAVDQARLAQDTLMQDVKLEAEDRAQREKTLKDSEIRRLTQQNQRLQRLLDQKEAFVSRLPVEPAVTAQTESAVMKELEILSEPSEDDSILEYIPSSAIQLEAELQLEEPRIDPFKALQRPSESLEQPPERSWGVLRISLQQEEDAQRGSSNDEDNHANNEQKIGTEEFKHTNYLDSYLEKEEH